jgi:TonB-dependent receptor
MFLSSANAPTAPSASTAAGQQPAGSIRGTVYDKDFDIPLSAATVTIVETNQRALTGDQGNFVLEQVPVGKYTLLFTKEGYVRQVKSDVLVAAGQLTDIDVALAGEFTEMDELVVQDVLQGGAGSEAALLSLRFESASLMDSISSDLMSRAGAGDAASALKLVSGASLQDGKFAVIRGLPDRYVSSQMNGVRLPSADEDKRAVELDQFPSPIIESIQVSKTFTPDQQGDASGGAVDVRLKGIPSEPVLQSKLQYSVNTNVAGSDFLTYKGGGVDTWGNDDGARDIQTDSLGQTWTGAVGTTTEDPPLDFKWSGTYGAKHESDDGFKFGGLASVFYERDSAYYDDGINDSWWVDNAGAPMTPETSQGQPNPGQAGQEFKTNLFDVTQGSQSVKWGGLGTLGLETRDHSINLTGLYTRAAEDTATLAIDTRGKQYFFPGHDPDDPSSPGHETTQNLDAAPYVRLETLEYVERTTATLQLNGKHVLPIDDFKIGSFAFRRPELDWTASRSFAGMDQPDKRFFSTTWVPGYPGAPATWEAYQPAQSFTLGNLQRVWKAIEEDSEQYSVNLKFPFQQWSEQEGYLKLGLFNDRVERTFDQDTFSNFADPIGQYNSDFDEPWSEVFPGETHAITASATDIDYDGEQQIAAWYAMVDVPLSTQWSVITGLRFESTDIGIVNHPEANAEWLPADATSPVQFDPDNEADVDFSQDDVLPSLGLVFEASEQVTLRGAYSETVARQTFKELTPSLQQEYLGAPIFVGNPDLQMSALKNFDLRADYAPYDGGLVSLSGFYKDITDPIEYVQRPASFIYTTPVNYPKGDLYGVELELRQRMEKFADSLDGLSIGANATLIESEVDLPQSELTAFSNFGVDVPSTRDMTNAPEYLYNVYLTYDLRPSRTQFSLFYTVQGDTLVAGGQVVGNFVPDVYAEDYGTLNFSVSQRFGKYVKLDVQAKNLTNPEIKEVYRSDAIGADVTRSSYTKGIEFSLALGVEFAF